MFYPQCLRPRGFEAIDMLAADVSGSCDDLGNRSVDFGFDVKY